MKIMDQGTLYQTMLEKGGDKTIHWRLSTSQDFIDLIAKTPMTICVDKVIETLALFPIFVEDMSADISMESLLMYEAFCDKKINEDEKIFIIEAFGVVSKRFDDYLEFYHYKGLHNMIINGFFDRKYKCRSFVKVSEGC